MVKLLIISYLFIKIYYILLSGAIRFPTQKILPDLDLYNLEPEEDSTLGQSKYWLLLRQLPKVYYLYICRASKSG